MGSLFLNVSHSQKKMLKTESQPIQCNPSTECEDSLALSSQVHMQSGCKGWSWGAEALNEPAQKPALPAAAHPSLLMKMTDWETPHFGKEACLCADNEAAHFRKGPRTVPGPGAMGSIPVQNERPQVCHPHTPHTEPEHQARQNSCQKERTHIYWRQRLAPPSIAGQVFHRSIYDSHACRCNGKDLLPMKGLRKGWPGENYVSMKEPAGHLSRIHIRWTRTYA